MNTQKTMRHLGQTVLLGLAALAGAVEAKEQFIDADGIQILADDAGAGTPVILVHGYAQSAGATWKETGVIDRLTTKGYRTISFDCRGHGRSSKPSGAEAYGLEMVKDIGRVLDAFQIRRAHLVGHSMGAAIVNKYRELFPHRVLGVALVGFGSPPIPDRFSASLEEEVRTNLERMKLLENNDPRALSYVSVGWNAWEVTDEQLARNEVATLIVSGKDDFFLPDAQRLAAEMSGRRFKVIAGDHAGVLERAEFSNILLEFFSTVSVD